MHFWQPHSAGRTSRLSPRSVDKSVHRVPDNFQDARHCWVWPRCPVNKRVEFDVHCDDQHPWSALFTLPQHGTRGFNEAAAHRGVSSLAVLRRRQASEQYFTSAQFWPKCGASSSAGHIPSTACSAETLYCRDGYYQLDRLHRYYLLRYSHIRMRWIVFGFRNRDLSPAPSRSTAQDQRLAGS